jgi:hypothetical protein
MVWPTYPAMEREQLIAADRAFAAALKRALQSGAETSAGVLATEARRPVASRIDWGCECPSRPSGIEGV